MTRRLIDRGNGVWDFEVAPGVCVELAREPKGWTFWGVNVDGERFGARAIVPPRLVEVFDAMSKPEVAALPNFQTQQEDR